ncbi:MAG: hypothetical protein U9N84_03035 [Actinomycetota bacterium]|nr:hypothetical protein [Actinomycetota bacterium]
MNETLLKLWADNPDASNDVVIVLAHDSEDTSPVSLGMVGYEPIPFQSGMFKATMTGAALLRLAERKEVEDITPDEEATIL